MIDFTSLAFHLEQMSALHGRLQKINLLAHGLKSEITCSCDFTEQNQHQGCPAHMMTKLIEAATPPKKNMSHRFKVGDRVLYRNHDGGTEEGVVTGSNVQYVFVCYGLPGSTSKATHPRDLEKANG